MIIGLMIVGGMFAAGYGLYKLDQIQKEKKEKLERIKQENARRELMNSTSSSPASAPKIPLKGIDIPDDDGEMFDFAKTETSNKRERPVYRSKHNDTVHETHTHTTVVNNYHDDNDAIDSGVGAFTGAMVGSMVGNALTQPSMPAPMYAPPPVVVEPSAPDIVQVPPENDGGSDVTYSDNQASIDNSNWNNDNSDNDDGGSDVTYDGSQASTDWDSSSNDSDSSTNDDSWSSSSSDSSWGDSGGSDDGGDNW